LKDDAEVSFFNKIRKALLESNRPFIIAGDHNGRINGRWDMCDTYLNPASVGRAIDFI